MAHRWYIAEPEQITNLLTNPSFETATTGWAGSGSVSRISTDQRYGNYCLQYIPTATTTDGVSCTVSGGVANTRYGFQMWVRAALAIPMEIKITGFGGVTASEFFTGNGEWQCVRVFCTTHAASGALTVTVAKNGSASTDAFKIDAGMVWGATTDAAQTHVDGDQPGCIWTGTKHASTSQRSVFAQGGRYVNLYDTYGVTLKLASSGAGMPPVQVVSAPYAYLAGSRYDRTKATDRVLNFSAIISADTQDDLHAARAGLIALWRPDRTPVGRQLIYISDDNREVGITTYYEAGFEDTGQQGTMVQEFTLRLYCPDPFWYEPGQDAALLTAQESLTNVAGISRRLASGRWDALGSGITDDVFVITPVSPSVVYVGGGFASAGGAANTSCIAVWNPLTEQWSALGTGISGGTAEVYDIVVAPDGTVYAMGAFTTAGGVACANIAKWNGSAWSAVGTGTNGSVGAGVIGADGSLYITGNFTTAGGGAAVRAARWNGSAWSALGSGLDANGVDVARALDGNLYFVGQFTTAGGSSANRVARWNPTTSAWSALSTGLSGNGLAVEVHPNGGIYIGGSFATAGGVTVNNICYWNGTSFQPLGSGLSTAPTYSVDALVFDADANLYAAGTFLGTGSVVFTDRMAVWNGSAWASLAIDYPSATNYSLAINQGLDGEELYVGNNGGIFSTAKSLALTTVTNNGTANTQPTITITGVATTTDVWEVSNAQTAQRVQFVGLSIVAGEVLTIDFANHKVYSTLRPFLNSTVVPGSDFATFEIIPGANSIGVLCTTTGTVPTVALTGAIRHWSYDGVAA